MTPDEYLRQIVEPTIADMAAHPSSKRHAFLACVATFHALDYFAGRRRRMVVRGEFRTLSPAFAAVDRIAHGNRRNPPDDRGATLQIEGAGDVLPLLTAALDFLRTRIERQGSAEEGPVDDTYFVVIPFDRNQDGDPEPGVPEEAMDAGAAERRARVLARRHAGAIAFSRSGDPATGEFEDAVILARFGDVGSYPLG